MRRTEITSWVTMPKLCLVGRPGLQPIWELIPTATLTRTLASIGTGVITCHWLPRTLLHPIATRQVISRRMEKRILSCGHRGRVFGESGTALPAPFLPGTGEALETFH